MHVGHIYPYAKQFWQARFFFWPGYSPRKIFVQCSSGYHVYWDWFAPGRVSDMIVNDAIGVGIPAWPFSAAPAPWGVQFAAGNGIFAPFINAGILKIQDHATGRTAFRAGGYLAAEFVFSNPIWSEVFQDDGYGGPAPPDLLVRPAYWSEV